MKKNLFTIFLSLGILVQSLFVTPPVVLADALGSGRCGSTEIDTAIGCINVLGSKDAFVGQLLGWAIGVAGGIAFLLIVYAGFMIMTSSGNPERLKAGQELLTSAISGIILLIFSVVVLNLIGVNILNLGAFGFGK